MKNFIILFVLFPMLLGSCSTDEVGKDKVKIRGKIVNPRTNQVVISRDFLGLTADSLRIENENEVDKYIKCPEEGLYFLYIYPEYQTIYLKPGDSLAFHINIDEFDESISFSGSLGFENNLLSELYLANEKESKFFYARKFDFSPDDFLHQLDSFQKMDARIIANYKDDLRNSTDKYKKILDLYQNAIAFTLREQYVKRHKDEYLPPNFTDYRRVLQSDIIDPNIIYMYAFADTYVEGKMKQAQTKKSNYFLEIAKQFESVIKDNRFKNNMLMKYCLEYIKEKQPVTKDKTIQVYFTGIDNQVYKDKCKEYIRKNNILQQGKRFPDVALRNPDRQVVTTKQMFKDANYLVSFWDLKRRRNFIANLKKLKEIKQKYPDLKLVVLNTDSDDFESWHMQIPVDVPIDFYQIQNKQDVSLVRPYSVAQAYFLSGDTIRQTMVNLYAPDFQSLIKSFVEIKK